MHMMAAARWVGFATSLDVSGFQRARPALRANRDKNAILGLSVHRHSYLLTATDVMQTYCFCVHVLLFCYLWPI
jgi:hypothetical protein